MAWTGVLYYKNTNAQGDWIFKSAPEPQVSVLVVHIHDEGTPTPPQRITVTAEDYPA